MPDSFLAELDLGDGVARKLRDRFAVSTDASQGLTATQQEAARTNINTISNFYGTMNEWNALTTAQKNMYDFVDIKAT